MEEYEKYLVIYFIIIIIIRGHFDQVISLVSYCYYCYYFFIPFFYPLVIINFQKDLIILPFLVILVIQHSEARKYLHLIFKFVSLLF